MENKIKELKGRRVEGDDEGAQGASEPESQTMESLLQEQSEFEAKLERRDIVWVKVISVSEGNVLVDVGEKRE
ncbi:MAG: hypothetical protein AAB576_03135, partial [Elusimicrobiota bacterium]